eukprot:scaffold4857_cov45-Phaeocystis_antarctica.AAC.1
MELRAAQVVATKAAIGRELQASQIVAHHPRFGHFLVSCSGVNGYSGAITSTRIGQYVGVVGVGSSDFAIDRVAHPPVGSVPVVDLWRWRRAGRGRDRRGRRRGRRWPRRSQTNDAVGSGRRANQVDGVDLGPSEVDIVRPVAGVVAAVVAGSLGIEFRAAQVGVVVVGRGEVDGAASVGAVGAQKGDGQEERQHSARERSDHQNAPKRSFRSKFRKLFSCTN